MRVSKSLVRRAFPAEAREASPKKDFVGPQISIDSSILYGGTVKNTITESDSDFTKDASMSYLRPCHTWTVRRHQAN